MKKKLKIFLSSLKIISMGLGGVLIASLLFDKRPEAFMMLGALLVPLVVVLFRAWKSGSYDSKQSPSD